VPIAEIRREKGAVAAREQIVRLVMGRKQHSENYFGGIRRELPLLYNLYRGVMSGNINTHKNSMHIPLILSTIQADVARKVATSFGEPPFITFFGADPGDQIIARKREALHTQQLLDDGIVGKAYDIFLTADLYGTTFIRTGWEHKEEDAMISQAQFLPLSQKVIQIVTKQRLVTRSGPTIKVLDGLDVFPQPGFRDPQEADWFEEREWLDLDDIRALATINVMGETIFDPSEVRRMEREGFGASEANEDYKTWRGTWRTGIDSDGRQREQYARPIELVTMWGKIPSELAPDGIRNRVITVANGRYLLRNRPMPFWSLKKPIRTYSPIQDPHYIYAPGKAEIAKKMQIIANRFVNQQLDVLDLFIDPVFFANRSFNMPTQNLVMRPGRFFFGDGSPQENIMPLSPDMNGFQMGVQMTEIIWKWMQQGLGIVEDTVMGQGAGNRTTAREYLGRSEAVATRLLLESRLFESTCFEPLMDDWTDLNRQMLDLPHEVLLLGQSATRDTLTGGEIPDTKRQYISGTDLVPNYEARAQGSLSRLGKGVRQQNLTLLLQAASGNPVVASAVNWINFFRQIFMVFDIQNVDELINTQEGMQKILELSGKGGAENVPGIPTPEDLGGPGSIPSELTAA